MSTNPIQGTNDRLKSLYYQNPAWLADKLIGATYMTMGKGLLHETTLGYFGLLFPKPVPARK